MKKTIGKLKLTQLSKVDLEAKQMNALRGGACSYHCDCYCTPNCSCTPYSAGGLSNSNTTSNTFTKMANDSNKSASLKGNESVMSQRPGYYSYN